MERTNPQVISHQRSISNSPLSYSTFFPFPFLEVESLETFLALGFSYSDSSSFKSTLFLACFPFGLIGATLGDDLGVTLGDFLVAVFFFGCYYSDSSSDSLDYCFLTGFF
jgi:hypothetical protein